jgi:small subunit ribosomal protein S14
MAKTSQVNRNKMREKMAKRDKPKRQALKDVLMDKTLPVEDRFNASLKLAQMPRNGAAVRVRLRCELTGRSRGNYRAPRSGQCRADPRHGQGQLVEGTARCQCPIPSGIC